MMDDAAPDGLALDPRVVVWVSETGGVAVRHPAPGVAVDAAFLAACPPGARVMAAADLPEADDLFDAWRLDPEGTITIDLPTARAAWRQRLDAAALAAARDRTDRVAIGLAPLVTQDAFLATLVELRRAIEAATTLVNLRAVRVEEVSAMARDEGLARAA